MILFVVKPTPTAQREASWDFSSYLEGVWVETGLTLVWEEGGGEWTNGSPAAKFCRVACHSATRAIVRQVFREKRVEP